VFADEVLRQGVAFAAAVAPVGGTEFNVAINLGSKSFLDHRLDETLSAQLEIHRVPGSAITIEVTESDALDFHGQSEQVFGALEGLGVRLSIDDFGTGYSNFTRLRELDANEVKVDRAFVQGLGTNSEDEIIVRATIQLAELMGLDVVAEGVETVDQLTVLRDLGCKCAQGFLWSRAVPSEDFLDLLVAGVRYDVSVTARELPTIRAA